MLANQGLNIDTTKEDYSNFMLPLEIIRSDELTNYQIIQNVVLKTLPNGQICLVEDDQFDTRNSVNNEEYANTTINLAQLPLQQAAPRNVRTILVSPVTTQPDASENTKPEINKPKQNEVVFKCIKCTNEFNTLAEYRKHMLWHKNFKRFKCTKCAAGFNVESNLKVHMALHSDGKPTCPFCNVSFQRVASLKSHIMIHQVEETYVCDECKAEFDKEDDLIKHLEVHATNVATEKKPLICSYCKVEFENPSSFKEHVSHHIKAKKILNKGKRSKKKLSKDGKYVCEKCNKGFMKMSLLERHERIHTGVKPYVCHLCNKGFSQRGTLHIHMRRHEGIRPYECTLCPAKFVQKGNLKVHIEKTHTASSVEERRYKCFHCACIFKKVASLNGHMTKIHAKADNGLNLDTVLNNLKQLEMQSASSERKPVIQEVKKDSTNKENQGDLCYLTSDEVVKNPENGSQGLKKYLVKQKKIGDIRYYFCSYCSKKFKKPSDLIRHIRIHTKERPFKCKFCSASFALKSTLVSHTIRHTIKKDYICPICYGTTVNLRSLNTHLKKHTPEEISYECKQCNLVFPTLETAEIHSQIPDNTNIVHNVSPIIKNFRVITNSFQQERILKPKVNVDDPSRKFQCLMCKAKFIKAGTLKRHMLSHSTDRKFKCGICHKSFLTSYRLKEHLNYHANIRNFQCKICLKKYVTANLLKRHQLVHTTQRPFSCWYCDKKFKTPIIRKQHLKKIHRLVEYSEPNVKPADNLPTVLDLTDMVNDDISLVQRPSNQISVIASNIVTDDPKQNILNQSLPPISTTNSQFLELPSETIQILSENPDPLLQQPTNSYETIYINSEGIQLSSTNNLYPHIKLQNSECLLINDSKILSINPSEMTYNSSELLNVNQFFNTNDQTSIHPDSPSKRKDLPKSDNIIFSELLNTNESNALYPNISFENELVSNDNSQITNILDSNSLVDSNTLFESDDINSNDIFEDTNFICTKCRKLYLNIDEFRNHVCSILDESNTRTEVADNTDEAPKDTQELKEKINQKPTPKKTTGGNKKGKTAKKEVTFKTCQFCSKMFKKNNDLIRHLRTHTGEKPYPCEKCDKKFALKSTLESHLRTHNPQVIKQFNCSVCNSFFTSKSSLKLHMNIHTGKKPYSCSYCPSKFKSATSKKAHELNVHKLNLKENKSDHNITRLLASVANEITPLEEPPTIMDVQEQLTDEVTADLTQHLQIVPNDILQQLQSSNIIIQDQTGLGTIPSIIRLEDLTLLNFKADTDDPIIEAASFSIDPQPSTSTSILATTEKPRNLECDICHKKYASKDVLRKHKKIHGLNKKFPCEKCKKGFDTQEEFDKHSKMHTGYRPHSCKYCNNSFADVKGLNAHIKRMHGNNEEYLIY